MFLSCVPMLMVFCLRTDLALHMIVSSGEIIRNDYVYCEAVVTAFC